MFCHKFRHKRSIFLPHDFLLLQRLIFTRLTICVVLWIALPMWFLPARRRIKAHRLVSWTCVLSFKSMAHSNPCLLCSPTSPKRSLFIKFSDKGCVQYAFRISSLHATCCASPSSIWSALAAIFASLCMNFEASHYATASSLLYFLLFGSKHSSPPYFYQDLHPLLFCKRARLRCITSSTVGTFILHFSFCKYFRTEQ